MRFQGRNDNDTAGTPVERRGFRVPAEYRVIDALRKTAVGKADEEAHRRRPGGSR